jgi:hypothetical protein
MAHPVIRGESADEYNMYLFVKADNDYRPAPGSPPHHRWDQLDIGELGITQYEKIIKSIEQLFETKGYTKYIIDPHLALFGEDDEEFLYLVKYGDEIPWADQRKLWKLNITPAEIGEHIPDWTEYGIVIWNAAGGIPRSFAINPLLYNYQTGAAVSAAAVGGKRRKTRRLSTKRRKSRRSRKTA